MAGGVQSDASKVDQHLPHPTRSGRIASFPKTGVGVGLAGMGEVEAETEMSLKEKVQTK